MCIRDSPTTVQLVCRGHNKRWIIYGIKINSECYKTIYFADDFALLGNDKEAEHNALHQMIKILKDKCSMTVKKQKLYVMKCYRNWKQKGEIWKEATGSWYI